MTKKMDLKGSITKTGDSLVLHGADSYYETPKDSLGIQFLRSLRSRGCDDVVNIDAATGSILTCGKCIEMSIKLSAAFKNMGLQHGDRICIVSENHVDYYVAVLAAFYIGVTVGVLNPEYMIDELRHGIRFSNPKVIICSSSAIKNAIKLKAEHGCVSHVILLTNEENGVGSDVKTLSFYIETATVDVDTFQPDDFDASETGAFIFLSSGTTGLPKGVLLTHLNITVTVASMSDPRYALIKPGDKVLTVLPFFHMFGNLVQLATLSMPITTIILDKFKPETYLQAIHEYQPNKLIAVPPLLMFLAVHELVNNYDVTSVKECICSGATVGKAMLAKLKQRFPTVVVRQIYGTTETAGFCLIHVPGSKDENVGNPIPGIAIKVRDPETDELLGPYKPGELCFKGPMVMYGYIGNACATKNAMDDDGFFRSGDIGYYDEDQCFFIVGRIKEIIKYKGFQVSPNELEQLILTHQKVKDCGVIGIPHERAGELPLAFIVKKSDQCITEEEIVDYVAERISVHKRLHGGVRFVDEIPKNHSGKILRAKLREML